MNLGHLASRLDDSEPWDQQLSGDEQQRLTVARALLHQPAWMVMDDATTALDAAMEKRVYEIFAARLPGTAVLSITNRTDLMQYHQRQWTIQAAARGAPPPVQSTAPSP